MALDELPRITAEEATEYGSFSVRVWDGPPKRVEAIDPPPPTTAWSRTLLEYHQEDTLSWDGQCIHIDLDNGSWTWVAEAQNLDGTVVYARWPD